MIGDCTSRGGQSLPAHFSKAYPVRFPLAYIVVMIFLVFGLFNIITSVFVESTMKGLAAQDAFVRRQLKYKGKHVKRKLHQLVERITSIEGTYKSARHLTG